MFSAHCLRRCQDRGVRQAFLSAILDNADVDHAIGDNCRLLRVSGKAASTLNAGDKLSRYAVVWSDRTSQVVTVLPIHSGRRGARYRHIH